MAQPPNLLQAPEPVETADLHFKLCCKLKAFDSETKYGSGNCSLIAISQYYGLCFFQSPNGFSVVQTKSINPHLDFIEYPKRDIILNLKPTHMSVDFTQKILAVVCSSNTASMLLLYNIASFALKDVTPTQSTPLSKMVQNPVSQLQWQPNTDSTLMICLTDGSVLALSLANKDGAVFTLPATVQATCLCWSPKGKQVVIGSATGTLNQYKPDLKLVKTLPAPPLFNGAVTIVGVLWISSFQFAVAYNDRNSPDSFPVITIVNAAKNEPVNVINYDDITFSTTLFRHHQIYMYHQSSWNLIFVSSANSIEVAVLHSKDGSNWEQWLLGDASRAELPLNVNREETFPLGFAFDYTSQETIPWGEGTLPPMPRLWLLSDEGVLCIFNVVHAVENAPQLCAPPTENIDNSLFVVKAGATVPAQVPAQAPVLVSTPASVPAPAPAPAPALGLVPTPAVSTAPGSEAPKNVQVTKSFTVQPASTGPVFGSGKLSYSFGSNSGFGAFTAQPQNLTTQVTITPIQGGAVFGTAKDSSQVPKIQLPTQQPQQVITIQPQTTGATATIKVSTTSSVFGTAPAPAYTFKMPGLNPPSTQSAPPVVKLDAQQGLFQTKPPTTQVNIFAGKTLPQSTPIKQPEAEKPQIQAAPVSKKPEQPAEPEDKGKSPSGSPAPETPQLPVVDDSVYLNALQDEIEHFNSELQQLSAKVGSLNFQVGTEEEKARMKKSIADLYEFRKELKETTMSQNGEIHAIVMDLMESFAWLEDAKSRNAQRKNQSYIELKKSAELDPISARHMSEISKLKYYIENQLKQLTAYLEKEWMDHQESYRMEVRNRMAVPPLEEVYKTMHYQLKILNKQRLLVEELKEKMAAKKQKNKTHSSIIMESIPASTNTSGNRVSELSKLAENLLQLKVSDEETKPKFENLELMKSQLKAIAERSKKLNKEKQAILRDALSERDMVKIRPTKTTLESSSFVRSLLIEKTLAKTPKADPKPVEVTGKVPSSPTKTKPVASPKPKQEIKPKSKPEKVEVQEKVVTTKPETPKSVFVFGSGPPADKPMIPLTVTSFPSKPEEKSPLASLSGIVSSIGKENETKPKPPASTFVFGGSGFQKAEANKEKIVFGSVKVDTKPEESKPAQTFTFSIPKPSESFGKLEPPKFGLSSASLTITPSLSISQAVPKTTTPNVSISAVSTTTPATSSPFTFSFSSVATTASTALPKMNLLFTGKDQSTGFGTAATGNVFSTSSFTTQSSAPIFGSAAPVFGGGKLTFDTTTTSMFGMPKTTAETTPQPTGFTFTQVAETKTTPSSEATVAVIKPTQEEEEVEVVKVEETVKKPEPGLETPKNSPKATVAPVVSSSTPEPAKTTPEGTTPLSSLSISAAPPNVQVVSTPQTTAPTATTTTATSKTTETSTSTVVSQPATTSVFSFSTSTSSLFGQTATTTAITTTSSIFGQTPATTTSIFGQVSSTSIFGGGTPTTPTSNIFGGSTPNSKPIFGQAATPTTTAASIFGASTPTTNAFGQATTPTSSPSGFGQQPDSVAQTANIFGQLLSSDGNRSGSVFGTTAGTPATTTNIFSTPKNIFGGAAATTSASIFGSASSPLFPQTTSVFGQPTTTTTGNIFGQAQTPTSNSFFGQNICSPFGGTSVSSNQSSFDSGSFNSKPVFGQSLFGQTTSNTSIFGGSSNTSVFGGSTSPTSGNVFQAAATTSSTFGSTSPGPFSSAQGSVAQTGFRPSTNTFQKPLGGFGSAPVFGGAPTATPAFGAAPTFSSTASFGSLPTFGSRPGVFDSSQGMFARPTGQSTTFENLANQDTVGFGNLAQQSQTQGFGGVSGFGSSGFENKPAFGGSSFSGWRSK